VKDGSRASGDTLRKDADLLGGILKASFAGQDSGSLQATGDSDAPADDESMLQARLAVENLDKVQDVLDELKEVRRERKRKKASGELEATPRKRKVYSKQES
jgi:hypothetical protein